MKKSKESQRKDNVVKFQKKDDTIPNKSYDYDMFEKDLRPVMEAIMEYGDKRYRDGRLKGLLDGAFSPDCKEIREIVSKSKPRKDK